MLGFRLSFVVLTCASGALVALACGGNTVATCGGNDSRPSSQAISAGPVAFVPKSMTVVRLFSQVREVIISESPDACQEYRQLQGATKAPAEARWLAIGFAPGVGNGDIAAQPPTAQAEIQRYCPGDVLFNGGTEIGAEAGAVDINAYAEGSYASGTYVLDFPSSPVLSGSFDAGFCDLD